MRKMLRAPRIGTAVASCAAIAVALLYLTFPHGRTANASPLPDLLSALPSGAPMLVYVDLAAVRASSFYQHRPDKGPLAVPNQDYGDFVRSTGFDFEKDLDRFVMASWPAPSAKEPKKNVVIAEGRFDRAKIRAYAMSKGKVEQQQGHEVFLFPTPAGTNALTFLDDHRIGIVQGTSIAPLFDAHSGDPAADPTRARASHVDGAAAFVIAQNPPNQNYTPPRDASPAAAQLASLAHSVQWVTVAASPVGDNLRISLEGECDNSGDAHQIQSMLEVARMFGRASLESPKTKQSMDPATFTELESLLTSAEVTQAGERVRILLELTPDIFNLKGASGSNQQSQANPKPQN